jgi:hypothetical protein
VAGIASDESHCFTARERIFDVYEGVIGSVKRTIAHRDSDRTVKKRIARGKGAWSGPDGQGHPRGGRPGDGRRALLSRTCGLRLVCSGCGGSARRGTRYMWCVRYGWDAERRRGRRPPTHDVEGFEASEPHRVPPWVVHGTYGHGEGGTMGSALESTLMPQQGIGGGTQEG